MYNLDHREVDRLLPEEQPFCSLPYASQGQVQPRAEPETRLQSHGQKRNRQIQAQGKEYFRERN